jgi:TP901 family phage tail tape measure protein
MPENQHIERVTLELNAPKSGIDGPNSGISVAINRLRALDRLIGRVQRSYEKLASTMARTNALPGKAQVSAGVPSRATSATQNLTGGADRSTSGNAAYVKEIRDKSNALKKQFLRSFDQFGANVETQVFSRDKSGGMVRTETVNESNKARQTKKGIADEINRARIGGAQLRESAAGKGKSNELMAEARAYEQLSLSLKHAATTRENELKSTGQAEIHSKLLAQSKEAEARASRKLSEALREEAKEQRKAAEAVRVAREEQTRAAVEKAGRNILADKKRRARADAKETARIEDEERIKRERQAQTREEVTSAGRRNLADKKRRAKAEAREELLARLSALKSTTPSEKADLRSLDNRSLKRAVFKGEELDRFNKSSSHIGKNMLDNVKHVTAWAASVGVLYGSLRLVTKAMSSFITLQYKAARLQVVMRDPSQVRKLTDDILALASANGRDAGEAMEAAIAWSRLGLTRIQVAEAVRVSLMAANVAEVDAAEATEHLSSLMSTYQLRVGQLASVLANLNAISNAWNVTNKDMLEGLTRTGAVAKQAGIPLAELMGLLGAGVAATGQTGANIGNSIKSITGALSDKNVQETLRNQFKFESTKDGGEDLKNMSELLGELFVRYQALSEAERRTMLFTVAGKNQASRMAALLDNYVRAQSLAIKATQDMSSAERENHAITSTLQSSFTALTTEFERFALNQGSHGPGAALTGIAQAMKNVLRIANTSPGSWFITSLTAALTALIAKLALTGLMMKDLGKKGVLGYTFMALGKQVKELGVLLTASIKQLPDWAQGFQSVKAAAAGTATTLQLLKGAALVALVSLGHLTALTIGVTLAVSGFNQVAGAMGGFTGTAAENVEKLAKEAEAASNAAESAAMAAKLFKTAKEALSNSSDDGRKSAILEQLSGFGYSTSMSREDAIAKLITDRNVQLDKAREERAKVLQKLAQQEQEVKSKIKEIEEGAGVGPFKAGGFTASARKESIEELKAKQAEFTGQRANLAVKETEDNQASLREFLEKDQEHLNYLEREREILSEIGEFYQNLPKSGRIDELSIEVSQLTAQRDLYQEIYDISEKRLAEGRDLTGDAMLRTQGVRDEAFIALRDAKAKLAGKDTPEARQIAQLIDQRRVAKSIFDSQADSFAVGDGFGEQTANKQRSLLTGVAASEIAAQHTKGLAQFNLMNQALEFRVKLTDLMLEGEKKLIELGKEEQNILIQKNREYQRGLLTSGPGELLRKLAVNQLSRGGLNTGGFFALSTEGRQDFLSRPENSEEIRTIRRDRRNLLAGGFGRTVGQIQAQFVAEQNGRRGLINRSGGEINISEAARSAANSLGDLRNEATALANVFKNMRAGTPAAQVPVTAQANFHGAGSHW